MLAVNIIADTREGGVASMLLVAIGISSLYVEDKKWD